MTKRALIWFKTDLRLTDNETVVNAISASDEVIPFYCLDERLLEQNEFGFKKIGNYRMKFLLESLADLERSLREKGSGLIFRIGKPELVIPQIVREFGIQKVYSKKEVATEEKVLVSSVEKALWEQKCVLEEYSTSTLYHAVDLPFGIKDIPDVFTAFRKRVEKETQVRAAFETPEVIKSPFISELILPSLNELGLTELKVDDRASIAFRGGETAAKLRLEHYFFKTRSISKYKETRNGLLGADYSSKFSPWLAQGCISPRWIHQQIKAYEQLNGANESTYWLIFELLWRDYFRFMMKKHGAQLFYRNGFNGAQAVGTEQDRTLLEKWMNGETGDNFVDANMRELKFTGFMSNRGRQNVASYLIDRLKLDWRLGAAYFEEQLIDYDVSSNWGNWAYLAGVGNDPRGKRVFDTQKQAELYDPRSEYRLVWLD
ncbi:MAG: DASH family cryptochrome [Cryomorphaceae bacterium]|jgi:deoxyribodipyrimidine photo-lyase|nr:DASH family cryptochrome [Cryomorphaceae bacterium]